MMVLTMEKRGQMEEIRGAETERKVVEDKEGEGTWALVLVPESVATSFIKVWGKVQPQLTSIPVKFEVLVKPSSRQLEMRSRAYEQTVMATWSQSSTEGASQVALVVKNLLANAGGLRGAGLIPGLGRSPGGGHGNPLQYSCLENLMDRGAWQATVHRVAKSRTEAIAQPSTATAQLDNLRSIAQLSIGPRRMITTIDKDKS